MWIWERGRVVENLYEFWKVNLLFVFWKGKKLDVDKVEKRKNNVLDDFAVG